MAYCETCGDWFDRKRGETWKTQCLDCWKAAKRDELQDLKDEIEILRDRNHELLQMVWQLRERPALPGKSDQFLKIFPLLVKVCHPDKHNGSRDAHEIMVWANGLRDDIRNGQAQ